MAIQEFCRTKSAMRCLTVSSSIHPISAPTGTDDDMGGNNKADALGGTYWGTARAGLGALRTTSSQTRANRPVSVIYDISRSGMHLRGTQKTRGVARQR